MAAGKGTRFNGKMQVRHKSLAELGGLSLIERIILAFREHGAKDILIVVGYNGNEIQSNLGDGSSYGVRIIYVENHEWDKENGLSLFVARKFLMDEGVFLLSMGDHWFEPESIKRLLAHAQFKNAVLIDKNLTRNTDLEEATKVKIDESGRVKEIGKDLKDFNAVDCGVFLFSPQVFDALQEAFSKGDYSLTAAVRILAKRADMYSIDVGANLCTDVDTYEEWVNADRKLYFSLRSASDGLVAKHINRRFSIPITRHLAKYDVSPNILTFLSFTLCIFSGLFFVYGIFGSLIAAGMLAQAASILDGVDGEIARLKFKSTSFGSFFDSILDRYGDGIIILGMAYYSYIQEPNIWVVIISVIALIGTPMSMMVKDAFFRACKEKYDADKMDGPAKFLLAGRDGRLFLIFVAGVTGQVFAIIVLFAFTTNLLALYRTIKVGLKIRSSDNVSKGNTTNHDYAMTLEKDLVK